MQHPWIINRRLALFSLPNGSYSLVLDDIVDPPSIFFFQLFSPLTLDVNPTFFLVSNTAIDLATAIFLMLNNI